MKYGVRLRGENFEIEYEGKPQILGFITTRFVKAATAEIAEDKAVDMIKNDERLNCALLDDRQLEPMIYLEEIWKERWWRRVGGKGYTFYPMESDS